MGKNKEKPLGFVIHIKGINDAEWIPIAEVESLELPSMERAYPTLVSTEEMAEAMRKEIKRVEPC